MLSTVDATEESVPSESDVETSSSDDLVDDLSDESNDDVLTTRMPTIQPPPYPPFSPQQVVPSLHTRPRDVKEKERSSSWDTKPGSWWPKLTGAMRTLTTRTLTARTRPVARPAKWTETHVGHAISVAGAAIVLGALFGAYVDFAFSVHGQRDGLAIALVVGRLVVALAFAAFGWGLVRYGERLALRGNEQQRHETSERV